MSNGSEHGAVAELARKAKQAGRKLAALPAAAKDAALTRIADALLRERDAILKANADDVSQAREQVARGEMTRALFDRLVLSPEKLADMVRGVLNVRDLPDPAWRVVERTLLDEGLELRKVTCPLGVLAVIFESRPDAVTQISALAIKSGNAVILKGGKEVERTMAALVAAIHHALAESDDIPPEAVAAVYGREAVASLLALDTFIDLVIPRGSNALVQYVQQNTRIPVLGHGDGVCHIYVDAAADREMALRILLDAKTQYPAACNSVETALVHAAIAPAFLPRLATMMIERKVRLRGCERTRELLSEVSVEPVADAQWHTEYSDLVLAIRVVNSLDEAIEHIERFGSHHTDGIVTGDSEAAGCFLRRVDSAGVYHNASTRFADGYRYGFGAEVGISTNRMMARGPVGLEGLVTFKYELLGEGQTVSEYTGPNALPFLHRKLPS
jgi:glutamate-5-semialdehyde dehydrogenase